MLTNKKLSKLYMCRRCINEIGKIQFRNYQLNYKYYYYHFRCRNCKDMHHIVKSVKPLYAWKLLFIEDNFPDVNLTKKKENKLSELFKKLIIALKRMN